MRPPVGEMGISGTTNYAGDILDEENERLYPQQAYGQPGSRTWGEWKRRRRTDPAFAAGLEYQASFLRDAAVSVKPAENHPYKKLAEQQADFVKWNLLEAMSPSWPEAMQRIVRGALGEGFHLEEQVAELRSSKWLPNGKGWALTRLADRQPVSVHQNGWFEENGRLKSIRQFGPGLDGRWVDVMLPANRVQLFSWNREGNNYRGVSVGRPVYHPMRVREQLIKLTGITLVREGAGLPIAYAVDKTAKLDPAQREALQELLANLVYHENASCVMPAGWKLEWIYSPGANKGHVVDAYNQLGIVILQQMQAQHLVLGTGETGSRSVGEVHTAQSRNFAQGVVAFIEGVLNSTGEQEPASGLIRRMVEWNWGPQEAYPKVSIELKRAELPLGELMTALKTAKDAGFITITAKDENTIRPLVQLQPIDEAERTAEIERKAALAPQLVPGVKPGQPGGVPVDEKARAGMGDAPPWAPRRALRESEKKVAFASIDSTLSGARLDFERGVKPLLVEALTRLAPEIRDAMADGDPSEISNLKLDMTKVGAFVDRFIGDLRSAGRIEVAKEFRTGPDTTLEKRSDGDPSIRLTEKAMTALEAKRRAEEISRAMRKLSVRRMEQRVLSDVEREALEAVRRGESAQDVINSAISTQLEEGAMRSEAGYLVTKAFNMGREEFAQERGDEVDSVELSALLDGGQCVECEALDGEEYDFNSAEHVAHVPPLTSVCRGGEKCRCLLVYHLKKDGGGE